MQQALPRSAFFYPAYTVSPSLGDARTAQQVLGVSTSAAVSALPALVSAGWVAASAVPFIGAGIAVAAAIAQLVIQNSGCGQTCIQTSQWANQAADALQKVVDGYYAESPRTKSSQALALQAFDQIWARLVQLCGDPQWGDAGKRCLSDRQRGACVWKQKYAPVHGTEPAIGECWNWFNGYRDVIANDPGVVPDPVISTTVDSTLSQAGAEFSQMLGSAVGSISNLNPVLLLGGGVLLLYALIGGKN